MNNPFISLSSRAGDSKAEWSYRINLNNIALISRNNGTGAVMITLSGDRDDVLSIPVRESLEDVEARIYTALGGKLPEGL